MAHRVSLVVPDWEKSRAVDAVSGILGEVLTLVDDPVEAEPIGWREEDVKTGPDAECLCLDSYRPDPDCPMHAVRVLPDLAREAV